MSTFKPKGVIAIVAGELIDEDGSSQPFLKIETEGICKEMKASRDGLQMLQALLAEAICALGQEMIKAPLAEEQKTPGILTAHSLPPLPKRFKAGPFYQ